MRSRLGSRSAGDLHVHHRGRAAGAERCDRRAHDHRQATGWRGGRRGLRVPGQPAFGVGEDVLLFLRSAPARSHAVHGGIVAGQMERPERRGEPVSPFVVMKTGADTRPLSAMQTAIDRVERRPSHRHCIDAHPADAAAAIARPYVLFNDSLQLSSRRRYAERWSAGSSGGRARRDSGIHRALEHGRDRRSHLVSGPTRLLPRCYMQSAFQQPRHHLVHGSLR